MIYRQTCRYYKGHKPCNYHKLHHTTCDRCDHYAAKGTKILIIKLDALGDVLRTTCILPVLKKKYPDSFITWITIKESVDLLRNNPYIDRILEYGIEGLTMLMVEQFDILINTSNEYQSAALAHLGKARKKIGYSIDKDGSLFSINERSKHYLSMGINDEIKKANKKSYQQLIFEMLELEYEHNKPILKLTPEEINFGIIFAEKHKIRKNDLVIGLNTHSSGRWQLKAWPAEKTIQLAELLYQELDAKIMILGGFKEIERNTSILEKSTVPLINSGFNNNLREFSSLINLTNLLVSSDTLAMHIGTALNKKIVALFGPTSHNEIELYGKGRKIFSEMDCLCCYKEKCDLEPNCMDNISVNQVFLSIKSLLKNQ